MNTEETQEQTNNQEQTSKTKKNYEVTMKKLVAVVGGKENLNPIKKVEKDVIGTVVESLLKNKKENLEKEVKVELEALLDKHVQMKKDIVAKKKELEKLEESKQKEFIEAANKLFGKIDRINELEQDYYNSLNEATNNN